MDIYHTLAVEHDNDFLQSFWNTLIIAGAWMRYQGFDWRFVSKSVKEQPETGKKFQSALDPDSEPSEDPSQF